MSTDAANIFSAALALPESIRLELANSLLASVSPPDVIRSDDPNAGKLVVERILQCDRDDVELIEHDEAMRRVRESLAARRKP